MKFEEIGWHDQTLSGIKIDRISPGKIDEIELSVTVDGNAMLIVFKEVYLAELKMNFGVIAEETIRYAIINDNDSEILNIRNRWSRVGVNLESLACYEINTNSTNSIIN